MTVSNRAITGSETQSTTITVVEGVDQAILIVDSCIPANEVYSFVLAPFTGMFKAFSNIIGVLADLIQESTIPNEINHTFQNP